MFQPFTASDPVLHGESFMADEVKYNLIHSICADKDAVCLKSSDETLVYAQSPGRKAWIWSSQEASAAGREVLLRELVDLLDGPPLPGVGGEPGIATQFTRLYAPVHQLEHHASMEMEAYCCPELIRPQHVRGAMRLAAAEDTEIMAEFIADFREVVFGTRTESSAQIDAAKQAIQGGGTYLWTAAGRPVSMAHIVIRTPRHARIGWVYTPSAERKNGYASALVGELCALLAAEGRAAVLYADISNKDSNKVYRSLGFQECGRIVEIDFR